MTTTKNLPPTVHCPEGLTGSRTALAFGALLLAVPLAPSIAAAQAAPSAAPAALEEVVVTARKREEKLQEVPLAITSFSSEALEGAGVQTLRDLSYLTPGITINSGGSEFGVNPVIRGLTNLNGGAGDANVSVFLDGVYLQNLSAINLALIDIERIEIVKGPVSALYGRNAYAGAINYITRKPGNDYAGKVEGTVGSDGERAISASFGGPIVKDVFSLRLAAGYENFDGSYTDQVNGLSSGEFEKKNAQAAFSFTPTQNLNINGAAYFGDDLFGPSALAYNEGNCGARTSATAIVPNALLQYCGRLEPDAHPVEVPALAGSAGVSGNKRRVFDGNLHVDYDFDFADASYIFGYNKITQQRLNDFLGLRGGITFALDPVAGNPVNSVNLLETFGSDGNTKDTSHEVRLASKQQQRFRWAVGGFYYDSEAKSTTIIGLDGRPIPAGRTLTSATGRQYLTSDGRFASGSFTESRIEETQTSGFLGLDFDLTEQLTLSGEGRTTRQEKSLLLVRSTACPATASGAAAGACPASAPGTQPIYPFGGPGSTTGNPSGTFNFQNYRFTAKYQFTPALMAYASWADGAKGGGFNTRATVAADLAFDPETNDTYEVGMKSTWLDNRVQINAALFHITTEGIQISGPSANTTSPGLVVKNFGSTTSNGYEVEAVLAPTAGLRFNLGVGYADAEFNDDAFDFGTAACQSIPSCASRVVTIQAPAGPRLAVALDGLQVPRSSKLTVNGGVSLDGPLANGWEWFSRGEFRYESRQYSLPNNFNYYGPRYLLNLRGGVQYDRYTVTAYIDNLTDDHTPETASYNARLNDFNAYYTMYLPTARTYGLTVRYQF